MSYADMVLATVQAAPPTRKNRRATSWPAPISAKVPYLFASRLIRRAFSSVPISISGSIQFLLRRFLIAANSQQMRQCWVSVSGPVCSAAALRLYGILGRLLQVQNESCAFGAKTHQPRDCSSESHSLGVFRWNPAAQIVGQRCVDPITARAQDLNFTADRQRQNAIRSVRGGQARLHILARYNCQCLAFATALECENCIQRSGQQQ